MVHASLFSGIGGPEVAAAMLGWENAFHCEINPFGRSVLDYWFPESKSYEDITKTDFREWRGRVDVLTGGFPCQPFSYAGKRGGRDDDRYLWPEMLRVIDEVRPAWVVGENVAGITTMVEGGVLADLGCDSALFQEGDDVHRYELEQSFTIERICRDLEGLGYTVQPMLIPAAAVGAPHKRDRIFILAHDDSSDAEDLLSDGGRSGFGRESGWRQMPEPGDGRRTDDSSNAESFGQEWRNNRTTGGEKTVSSERPCRAWKTSTGLLPENRWAGFPAVSPVCRGDDGLPFDVDDLSIPFTRWRTESLKAYGNAIVPQVMYRIFQAIEEATKNN